MAAYEDSIVQARERRRRAMALRGQLESSLQRSVKNDPILTTDTGRGNVPITSINFGGIINNALDNYRNRKLEQELASAEYDADTSRSEALRSAVDSGGLSPSKMVDLSDAGVDPAMLKMLAPQAGLGAAQLVQYGRDAAGMRAVNKVQPGTFSEDEIAQAAADDSAARAPRGRSGGGGGGGVSSAQIANYGRTAAGMRAINKVQPGTFSDDEIALAETSTAKPSAIDKSNEQAEKEYQTALSASKEAAGAFEGATQSGLGKMVDEAAAFFGKSTTGAQQAARLKVVGAKLVGTVPRFSGPQSDKDVQLYKEAAGQIGDDAVPIATRQAALETVMRLFNEEEARRNSGKPVVSSPSDWLIEEAQ